VPILGIHGTDDTTVPPAGRPDAGWPPLGDWIAGWANRDGCAPAPVTLDDAELTETAWRACGGGAEVRLLLVTGLGHTWWPPANDRIWDFFEAHPLPG
jgi:polyhydroxybutyrate depolymerase